MKEMSSHTQFLKATEKYKIYKTIYFIPWHQFDYRIDQLEYELFPS